MTLLFLGAVLGGSLVGSVSSEAGAALGGVADPLILLLVGALFFTLRLDGLPALRRAPRMLLLALALNFVLIPAIAFALSSVLLPDHALRVGVLIYCLFPCTDWFLGFTRIAGGDTATGAALIPIQMVLQLAMFPVWLGLFTGHQISATLVAAGPALLTWFVLPAGIALVLRLVLRLALPAVKRQAAVGAMDRAIPIIIAAVIFSLFAAHVGTILAGPIVFARVLLVVFLFFITTFLLAEGAGRLFRLRHPEQVLLTMTTSARNAPLMLAVTTVALPNQPVVYAAIVLGMLIEFPHLAGLTHLSGLMRSRRRADGRPAIRRSRGGTPAWRAV
jgi:ACR3 family arsenite transporter